MGLKGWYTICSIRPLSHFKNTYDGIFRLLAYDGNIHDGCFGPRLKEGRMRKREKLATRETHPLFLLSNAGPVSAYWGMGLDDFTEF
jgi:hypothetical protein